MKPTLYYVHDPMCSWCWGFSRVFDELLDTLPKEITVKRLLGGLAPDSDLTMPESMQESIKSNWSRIEETISGVKFNFDFWQKCTPRRSTYPACRAVISARNQGVEYDEKMTKAIQYAYYQQARNTSDSSTHIELAQELNLSIEKFKKDLLSDKTNLIFNKEMALCRKLYVESYPSLVLVVSNGCFKIKIDYNNSCTMREQIKKHI